MTDNIWFWIIIAQPFIWLTIGILYTIFTGGDE